jgi:acetyltransferase-like isoleucine patch superfamily enzyme
MAYLTNKQLYKIGFNSIGENVKISDKAAIYNAEMISIGDNSRIDDFCVISGKIEIGRNVHITPQCLIAGGKKGVFLDDFTTFAYGVKIFSQSDDYSGITMTNSTIPKKYKNEFIGIVKVKKYSIIGASSIIMPGVEVAEGTAVGAMSLVLKNTTPWSIYAGVPAKKIKDRKKQLLDLLQDYLKE